MDEDGSIFVCFVCEKEFRQVTLLEDHMKTHGTMPDMSTELPSRKRSARGGKTKMPIKTPKTDTKINDCVYNSKVNLINSPPDKVALVTTNDKVIAENQFTVTKAKNVSSLSNGNTKSDNLYHGINSKISPNLGKPVLPSLSKVKIEKSQLSGTGTITKKKIELGSADDLTRRAMRIKQYILSREQSATKKRSQDENEDEESVENTMMEYDGARESIVMVDSSFFSSGTSTKPPMGPTIMNSEPLGFICPLVQKRGSLGNDSQFRRKRNSFMRVKSQSDATDGFDVMDNFEEEEGEIGLEIADDDNKEYSSNYTIKFQGNNLSRGRGKRGRPSIRIKEEDIGIDDSGEDSVIYKEVRPGRRSQPRRESEDDLEYQCLECFKQFR